MLFRDSKRLNCCVLLTSMFPELGEMLRPFAGGAHTARKDVDWSGNLDRAAGTIPAGLEQGAGLANQAELMVPDVISFGLITLMCASLERPSACAVRRVFPVCLPVSTGVPSSSMVNSAIEESSIDQFATAVSL